MQGERIPDGSSREHEGLECLTMSFETKTLFKLGLTHGTRVHVAHPNIYYGNYIMYICYMLVYKSRALLVTVIVDGTHWKE